MEFDYTGSGIITFHGCPGVEIDYAYVIKFAIGSTVYDLISARIGILESVSIKKAWFVCDPRTRKRKVLYKDKNNWLHNEYDLGSQTDAINAITVYYNYRLDDVNTALMDLNC